MEQWQNAKLDDTRNPRATPDVWFPLNDPKEGGRGGITISLARDTGVSPRPRPERTDLPPEELPARLKAGLSLPPGEYTLADLAERLSASKVVVRFPSYAANRKVVAFSHDGKLGEILSGLCVLYGWTATPTRSGYQVGLPRFDPAKDAQDLHLKLQRMVPPAVRYQVRILSQGEYGRSGHQWAAIIQEAEHLGGEGMEIPSAQPLQYPGPGPNGKRRGEPSNSLLDNGHGESGYSAGVDPSPGAGRAAAVRSGWSRPPPQHPL